MGFFSTFRNGGRGRPRRSESGGLARRPIIRLYFQRHRREEGEECERFIDDERRRGTISTRLTRVKRNGSNDTLARIFKSLGTMLSLLCFYGVMLASYALLGMQLFPKYATDALKRRDDEAGIDASTFKYPRENFETYPKALLAMFTVSTGEGWVAMLYHYQ